MRILTTGLPISAAVFLLSLSWNSQASPGHSLHDSRQMNFTVYLDDKEIGYHRYELTNTGSAKQVIAEAEFEVNFLFITAYRYRHRNTETWRGDCLQRIRSETNANGELHQVEGEQTDEGFELRTMDGQSQPGDCIKTFAYWNPEILTSNKLLNSQTGELIPVRLQELPVESKQIMGEMVPVLRYQLIGEGVELELWYGRDDSWLGLESKTANGRTLRYVRT